MIIYPAMDLMGGRCVRLEQGRFADRTTYPDAPADALARFAAAGAQWAHIVDLDGARERSPRQHDLIVALAENAPLNLQVAGGFRSAAAVARMLEAGVGRVVIGSLAVQNPGLVQELIAQFGADRITLALDVNIVDGEPLVATAGWTESSGRTLWDVASAFPTGRHLLVTDISRDGMLGGPNFGLLDAAVERLPQFALQASGGVSTIDDLRQLRTAGAIVGKALWEGRIDLAEALQLAGA